MSWVHIVNLLIFAAAFVMLLLYLGMRTTKWYRAGARELTAPDT